MQQLIDHAVVKDLISEVGPDIASIALETFVSELTSLRDVLAGAAAADDFDAMRHAAHRLKGSASGFGVQPLTASLERIEKAIHEGDPESAKAEIPELLQLTEATLAELQAMRG